MKSQKVDHNDDISVLCKMMFVETYPFEFILYSCMQIPSQDDANASYEHKHT